MRKGDAGACEFVHERDGTLQAHTEQGENVTLIWNRTVEWNGEDWRDNAACRNCDPDLFFPIGTTGQAVDQIEAAKMVCATCDAQQPCLEFALATNQESGVWGATSEDERRKLRKVWLAEQRRAS